jgi:branched-subunit amino acid transport protein
MNDVLLIAGMTLVTFGIRYGTMAMVGRITLPERVVQALRFVPPAVLSAIIVPAVLIPDGIHLYVAPDNARLVASLVTAGVMWRTKNLLLTIVLGMLALWLWGALVTALAPV